MKRLNTLEATYLLYNPQYSPEYVGYSLYIFNPKEDTVKAAVRFTIKHNAEYL
jgi:hypothetical protein